MRLEKRYRNSQPLVRWSIYFIGLLIMAFGIVCTIKADIGCTPWDVLHIGLYKQLGFTIGTWSILAGIVVLTISSLLTKSFPQIGAIINMLVVGLFIDMFMLFPFLITPSNLQGKIVLLLIGIVIMAYGIGIYISGNCGAGPRDSLMMALTSKSGWKVQNIRFLMEFVVLIFGWFLGGPVFIGTIIYSISIGYILSFSLPQCKLMTDFLTKRIQQVDVSFQNINH